MNSRVKDVLLCVLSFVPLIFGVIAKAKVMGYEDWMLITATVYSSFVLFPFFLIRFIVLLYKGTVTVLSGVAVVVSSLVLAALYL